MVLVVSVLPKDAEKVKRFLLSNGIFDRSREATHDKGMITFPITKSVVNDVIPPLPATVTVVLAAPAGYEIVPGNKRNQFALSDQSIFPVLAL